MRHSSAVAFQQYNPDGDTCCVRVGRDLNLQQCDPDHLASLNSHHQTLDCTLPRLKGSLFWVPRKQIGSREPRSTVLTVCSLSQIHETMPSCQELTPSLPTHVRQYHIVFFELMRKSVTIRLIHHVPEDQETSVASL